MAKKSYPLRINEQVIAAMQRWADDDLRSLNAQITATDIGRRKMARPDSGAFNYPVV